MVTINIQKKDLFLILAIVVFMTGAGIVISYNPSGTGGTPSIMGHSVDEISLPACTDGQILKYTAGKWQCADLTLSSNFVTKDQLNNLMVFAGTADTYSTFTEHSGQAISDTCPGNVNTNQYNCKPDDVITSCIDISSSAAWPGYYYKRSVSCALEYVLKNKL